MPTDPNGTGHRFSPLAKYANRAVVEHLPPLTPAVRVAEAGVWWSLQAGTRRIYFVD
jgi:hypothetical protein